MANSSKGSSTSKPIALSPSTRHTDKGHDHAMGKGAASQSAGVNKSIRIGAGMGPSGKLGKQ